MNVILVLLYVQSFLLAGAIAYSWYLSRSLQSLAEVMDEEGEHILYRVAGIERTLYGTTSDGRDVN